MSGILNSNHILCKSVRACVANVATTVVRHDIYREDASAAVRVAKVTIKHESVLPISHPMMEQSGIDKPRETLVEME